jgi:phosphoserine phosphatase
METIVRQDFNGCQDGVREALARKEDALVVNGLRGDGAWFAESVRDAEAGLFDFDGTLHAGNQWKDIAKLMTEEDKVADRAEAAWYFARKDGEPTAEEIVRFGFNSIRRMASSGILRQDFKDASAASPPRPGAVGLLRSFPSDDRDSPCAIVSFGMSTYILDWCAAHRVGEAPIVASTSVRFSNTRWIGGVIQHPKVIGANPLTFVGTHNKGHVAHAIVESFGVPMRRVLVVGDAPTDMHMMSAGNLAVLIVPHGDNDPDRVAFRLKGLAEMWPKVAAVLVSDSLAALAEMRVKRG